MKVRQTMEQLSLLLGLSDLLRYKLERNAGKNSENYPGFNEKNRFTGFCFRVRDRYNELKNTRLSADILKGQLRPIGICSKGGQTRARIKRRLRISQHYLLRKN